MEKVVGQILHQLATDGSNRHGSKYSNTRSTTTDDIKIGLGSSRVKYMRTFNQRSDNFVLSAIIMILFASTIWISSVSALSQQQTSLGVKITDLAKGQQVAIGKNFTLSGTSSYNATSSCGVFN